MRAANAGWYSTAAIATPATNHAAANTSRLGAVAIATTAGAASTDPAVMIGRGPTRSSHRPTTTPMAAATSWLAENAAATAVRDQPVSALMVSAMTGKA